MAKDKQEVKSEVDITTEAINLVKTEKTTYQDAVVFVTKRVAFKMRLLIEVLRKNYLGIFDKDTDPITGKKLTWIPLTEWVCDNHVNNSDIDTKDFNFRAKIKDAFGLVSLVRHVVRDWMDEEVFGEDIDETERQLAIDGSHIWKTYKGYDSKGKAKMCRMSVDILNTYFDLTSKSIQDAYRFTERGLLSVAEIKAMDGWINTEDVVAIPGLHPTDLNLKSVTQSTAKYVDIWETWGKIPLSLITGKSKDKDTEVDGHIVVSGLESPGKERVHLIETNPSGLKPYEEFHTKKISGRWLARGPAESVMMLQAWVNMIVNIRKLRAQVSQLGIFKLKKGSNISPQVMTRMMSNGIITVNSMDDIEQFVVTEAGASSYKDEDGAVNWAQKITHSFEAVTGEPMPSTTPATNAVIQKNAAGTSFVMFKKGLGFGMQRWLKRHALPILAGILTPGEILRITGDADELNVLDERLVNYFIYQELDKVKREVTLEEVERERQNALSKLKKLGRERFVKLIDKIDFTKYDVQFYLTNEEMDTGKMAQDLLGVLKIAPQYQDTVVKYIFDLMGLDTTQFEDMKSKMPMPNQPTQPVPGQMPPTSAASPQAGMM